jgi:hypothetical protein
MSETPGRYDVGVPRPQPPPSFEAQLKAFDRLPCGRWLSRGIAIWNRARRTWHCTFQQPGGKVVSEGQRSQTARLSRKPLTMTKSNTNQISNLLLTQPIFLPNFPAHQKPCNGDTLAWQSYKV